MDTWVCVCVRARECVCVCAQPLLSCWAECRDFVRFEDDFPKSQSRLEVPASAHARTHVQPGRVQLS